ncbi:acyltransferase family protein [Rhodococcus rhodochrous]|uniref:acyltransferase family protein n=1 Tax=Rhodococcus rhodochrous TaxID=1829 RepID=UPI00188B16DB|nr:acyltransferase family protein [Rhodococcus rhodochrous]MBF4480163.1 acyltransferase [Rhodococcus rhodochrous]
MSTTLSASGRAHRRQPKPQSNQRLDIQGLRMVAVMLVVLSHLFDWPRGGFIGVDVFFVISGFLITGSLLHTIEKTGRISFSSFYRRRIRRIIPAATIVLVVTVIASYVVFAENRFKSTVWDAVAAFFFVSNWRFGVEGTDYFNADGPVSALQHYWSLSVEEQFYFVWPVVILAIGVVSTRRAWSRQVRIALSTGVMGTAVLVSFLYSVLDTASNPTWAYFSTLTRVWELGVGALLAITISWFERIPDVARPFIAWSGLILIGVGAFAISEGGGGFPGPWAAVPVLGSAMVIAAGVAGNHQYLGFLTNRVSTYVGDISYSLYLWHWPVIVLFGALVDPGPYYYISALLLMFGFSIGAYHLFENPIRESNWLLNTSEKQDRSILDLSRWRRTPLRLNEHQQSIGIGALALVTAGAVAAAIAPAPPAPNLPPVTSPSLASAEQPKTEAGPAQTNLATEILEASQATQWPDLSPSVDEVISAPPTRPDVSACSRVNRVPLSECVWGDPAAPRTLALVGDSTALGYAETFKRIVADSNGQWKMVLLSLTGCRFIEQNVKAPNADIQAACPERKTETVEELNRLRPDLVVMTNSYNTGTVDGRPLNATDRFNGLQSVVDKFASSVGSIVFLAPPPFDADIKTCFTKQSTPANCAGTIVPTWSDSAKAERELANNTVNGTFVTSIPWFCTDTLYCPSFVGKTPVKFDRVHTTPEYGEKIGPAVGEAFIEQGLLK